MKKIVNKLKLSLIFSIFMCLFFSYVTFADEIGNTIKTDDFEISVEVGFDGYCVGGNDAPAKVKIINKGEDFSGTLKIINGYSPIIAYEKDFTISANETKYIDMIIKLFDDNAKIVGVEVCNESGKKIVSENVYTNLRSEGSNYETIIGILSNDYDMLSYFGSLKTNYKINANNSSLTSIVELSEENIPENKRSLRTLNYLIIDNYNTSKLSDKQYEVIKDWVEDGGVLILSTGLNYKKVLEKFTDDFISYNFVDINQKNLVLYGGTETENQLIDNIYMANIEVDESKDILTTSEIPFIKKVEIGEGSVNLISFGLGDETIVNSNSKINIAKLIINSCATDYTKTHYYTNYDNNDLASYERGNMISKLRDISIPHYMLYVIIFIVYVFVVGPITYLILKKLDKREFLWLTVPCVSVVFILIVFVCSSNTRITQTLVSQFSAVEYDKDKINEEAVLNITNPENKKYSILIKPEFNNYNPVSEGYYYSDVKMLKEDYVIKKVSEGTQLNFNKSQSFTSYLGETSRILDNSENLGFDINLNPTFTDINGTITNNTGYDLSEAVIYYNQGILNIGEIKNGETKTISGQLNSLMNKYNSGYYITGDYDLSRLSVEEKFSLYTRRNIYTYFVLKYIAFNDDDYYGDLQGIVFGIADNYLDNQDNLAIANNNVKSSGKAVLYQKFEKNIEGIGDYYVKNINNCMTENYDSGYIDITENYSYNEMADVLELEYIFDNNMEIEKLILLDKLSFMGKMEFYNYKTGKYEEVSFMNEEIKSDVLSPYIDENNQIRIKYIFDDGQADGEIPLISVSGRLK